MIKAVGTIDLTKVAPPKEPIRYVVVSKNRKKASDRKTHHEYGRLTRSEAEEVCCALNKKWNGRFYWCREELDNKRRTTRERF